ncbi:glycosyltransferase [Paenarthrobacter sp. DKR-5]|uniref:glycosyltransferase family 2 protein n=1 Tax=Paenarthrobacter sp. DKR-5 TaxID=2835535 RepID=UPI001BDBDEAA|nr:glycosyltransferase family 2 protein [Paenarthrobacter sp. DKR-5]MBT1003060.1 glycosyltransferase [Paenarthrobacter sp. DKR-5]
MPQLSVLIPVKDGMPYLKSTVSSTLRAMPRDAELLVLDDGSTDGTGTFLASVRDKRLRVFRNEQPAGVAAASTALLSHASGEHVARIDGDDICLPWRFTVQRRALEGVDMVFSQALMINAKNVPYRPHLEPGISPEAMPLHLLMTNVLMNPTMYAARSALESLGGYQPTPAEDYDLWLRAAAAGLRMLRIPWLPTIAYRRHQTQLSQRRAWSDENGDRILADSFGKLAADRIGFHGSASTILYNRPAPGKPYPEDPDVADFARCMMEAASRLGKRDRHGVEARLRASYRL